MILTLKWIIIIQMELGKRFVLMELDVQLNYSMKKNILMKNNHSFLEMEFMKQ